MTSGPDFLCIGQQKAGTGWLYDQLQHRDDFWMPPIKELHYFDRPYPDGRTIEAIAKRQKSQRMTPEEGWRELTDVDREFFSRAIKAFRAPIDLDRYGDLFALKAGKLSGDITPSYSTLDDDRIASIAAAFPALRVMLIIREPVSRIWSQIAMNDRRGKFSKDLLENPAGLIKYINKRSIVSKSFPTRIVDRWQKHFTGDRFRLFFFDDIVARPDAVRAEMLAYLGADAAFETPVAPDFNRKAELPKVAMTDSARAALVAYFGDELRACRDRFGGPAVEWAARYGVA